MARALRLETVLVVAAEATVYQHRINLLATWTSRNPAHGRTAGGKATDRSCATRRHNVDSVSGAGMYPRPLSAVVEVAAEWQRGQKVALLQTRFRHG